MAPSTKVSNVVEGGQLPGCSAIPLAEQPGILHLSELLGFTWEF